MKFEKKVLYTWNMPYALGKLHYGSEPIIVAATEDRGPIVICRPPYTEAQVLVQGPGGCMSLISDEAVPTRLFAIMGCFLGYKFQEGAVYAINLEKPLAEATKIANLPFAHRMEVVTKEGEPYLVVANLASDKKNGEDWTKTGTVYSLKLPVHQNEPCGPLVPIIEGIHKNHGFLKCKFEARESILFSGSEGLFLLDYTSPGWNIKKILSHEVSEIAVFDLDNDGKDELVTIEPFHGNKLVVYKQKDTWEKVWESELSYGHCVLAQKFYGHPSILVSNRAGTKDLVLYQFPNTKTDSWPEPQKIVIEHGVGAANMVITDSKEQSIFSTNQVQGELVRYVPSP